VKKRNRATPKQVEATRLAVISLLRRNPLMSYKDAADIAGLTPQRLGQLAATDPTLAQYRAEQWEEHIAKVAKGYPKIKL
jgi:hypothetical protein